jgi:hypothetical protein
MYIILLIQRCMKRGIFIVLCLFTSITVSFAQQLGFHFKGSEKKIKIPFELHNNLIIIPVILNNQLPLKFVLDTGVRSTILVDKSLSDFLNLKYVKKFTISGVGGEKSIEAYITNNVSLALPGIYGEGHAMLVLENDLLELKNYLGTDVHGIIGYELFSRFVVEINYSRKILTFRSHDAFKPKRSYKVLPMTIKDTKPYITARLIQDDGSEAEVQLMVDSGSSQTLFIEHDTDPLNIKIPDSTIYSNIGRGLGGPIKGYVGRLPVFELGSYKLEDIIANYPDNDTYIDKEKHQLVNRNGTIGGEILSRFNVIFDFPGGKFYFKKSSGFKDPYTYNLSGLTVKATGPEFNVFVITEVRKNSAGENAGVMEGDVILSINGRKVNDLKLNDVIGFLNSRPNKNINLLLRRNEEEVKVSFRLRSLI